MEKEEENSSPSPVANSVTGPRETGYPHSPGIMVKDLQHQWKPDWSHLYPYYHPEVVFEDSIQRIVGIEAFTALCERMAKRCESLQMEILSIAQDSNIILMDWIMTMAFKKYPSTPLYGSTRLTLHADGRIIHQRDYFDLWGDIFNGIPYFKKAYRKFMRKNFG